MASKNIVALFLTINLVLFGFTVAQPPMPAPTCPRDIQACVNVLNLASVPINIQTASPCCTLVAGLDADAASICFCNALKVRVLGAIIPINVPFRQLVQLCRVAPPPGFQCA